MSAVVNFNLRRNLKILFTGASFTRSPDAFSIGGLSKAAALMEHDLCQDINYAPDLLICLDYHPRFNRELKEARRFGIPTVLIKQEPSAIIPQHKHDNPGKLFDKVITKGSSKEGTIFNCLLSWDERFISNPERLERVVAISADKWSFVPSELYSLRVHAYSQDPRVDVYGHGWNQGFSDKLIGLGKALYVALTSATRPKLSNLVFAFRKPINYLGITGDKSLTLSRYKVSLVIENDLSSMSEKLVDTILAGTIPVYVGPEARHFGIPANLVIQCSPDTSAIRKAITQALAWDGEDYRLRASLWAESLVSKSNWNPEDVDARLLQHIVEWHKIHLGQLKI
jgi:hypothetical protein